MSPTSPMTDQAATLPEHVVLQRVAVRMLHDPRFRAAVYANPEAALTGLPLTAASRALLVRSDARAWGIDVHRSTRVLKSLLDEFPVSALALLHEGVAAHALHAFFQSAAFHEAVMARGSLTPAFGHYLEGRAKAGTARAMIALESGVARVRRRSVGGSRSPVHPAEPAAATWLVRGACEALSLPAGALAAWDRARSALAERGDPVARLLGKGPHPRLPGVGKGGATEAVLLEQRPGAEPTAAFAGEALADLLGLADRPVPRERLVARAEAEGASRDEAAEIVAELVADGLLVVAAAP